MKHLVLLFIGMTLVSFSFDKDKTHCGGKCTGSKYCRACTNCNYCKYCNSGGYCGVCRPEMFQEKKTIVKPKAKKQLPAKKKIKQ